jgi:outer membrane immunogenic protein
MLPVFRGILVAAAVLGAASAAQAQSGPAPIWQGAYLGATAGGSFGKFETDGSSSSLDHKGFALAGHAGYNFQASNIVFGIEGDIGTNLGETNLLKFSGSGISGSVDLTTPFIGSIRGRVGVAAGSALIYGTGGFAFGKAKIEATASAGGASASAEVTDNMRGYVFGGGVEYKFSQNMSGRVEALRYGFKDVLADGVDYKTTTVRAGLTYHFN